MSTHPKCVHGVALYLDKGHSCFECERLAVERGMPLYARELDEANAILAARHDAELKSAPQPAPDAKTTATIDTRTPAQRLMQDILEDTTRLDINGQPDTYLCSHAIALRDRDAEIKALQRVILDMRKDLAVAEADKAKFAHEAQSLRTDLFWTNAKLRAVGRIARDTTRKA